MYQVLVINRDGIVVEDYNVKAGQAHNEPRGDYPKGPAVGKVIDLGVIGKDQKKGDGIIFSFTSGHGRDIGSLYSWEFSVTWARWGLFRKTLLDEKFNWVAPYLSFKSAYNAALHM
jgi:hypothetical protein